MGTLQREMMILKLCLTRRDPMGVTNGESPGSPLPPSPAVSQTLCGIGAGSRPGQPQVWEGAHPSCTTRSRRIPLHALSLRKAHHSTVRISGYDTFSSCSRWLNALVWSI